MRSCALFIILSDPYKCFQRIVVLPHRPKHRHTVNDPQHTHTVTQIAGTGGTSTGGPTGGAEGGSTSSNATGITVQASANDNLDAPPYLVVTKIVFIGV